MIRRLHTRAIARIATFAVVGSLGALDTIGAQSRILQRGDTLPTPIAGTLMGVVVDSAGTPVGDISVYVYEARRQVRTGADGRFRFDEIDKGRYTVSVRSVGFLGVTERVQVKAAGAVVRLRITRLDRGLPAVITTAARGGLSGVVSDTSLHALKDVTVKVMGTQYATRTDSAGRFFLAARPGSYLLRVERNGYERQLIGVTVPENEGREVAVWLSADAGDDDALIGANLFDFEQRRIRGRAVSYASFSRDDLMATGGLNLMQASARSTAQRPTFESCAYLNGGPAIAPLWAIGVGEVEYVETVLPDMNGRTKDILGRPSTAARTCSYNAWLRR